MYYSIKHGSWDFFLAVICADFLGFFSLPTFMSEVEGLGWQTGSWTKGHAKTTKLPGPDHVASSACFSLQPQAVSWCNADASIFPPSNAGFMFSYCSQQLLFYLSFFLSGEEWEGDGVILISFLPSCKPSNTLISSSIQNLVVVFLY